MGVFSEFISGVLENQDDFFTSGLSNAINNYYETKRLFTILSIVIGVVCFGALFVRAVIF